MQEQHLAGDLPGEAHFMGHHDHRPAFLGQPLNHPQHLTHQLRVECRGRFVEQHHLRLHRQRPGNRHPLLLAAGEKRRVLIGDARRQANLVQITAGAVFRFLFAATEHPARGHGDVFQHGHVAPQVEVLEHHRQSRAQALQFIRVGDMHAVAVGDHADRLAIKAHGAIVGLFEEVDAAQKGAFARAAGADQADHVAGSGLERNAFEYLMVAIAFVQTFNRQFVHGTDILKAKVDSRCDRLRRRPRGRSPCRQWPCAAASGRT